MRHSIRFGLFLLFCFCANVDAKRIAYIHGDVSEDVDVTSGGPPAYDQMLLTDYGNTGLSSFRALVQTEGHNIDQYYDAETIIDADFLSQFDVVIFGLHQRKLNIEEKQALDLWIKDGGGILIYSDSASGGKYNKVGAQNTVGQTVVNNIISAYGMQVCVDQANGVKAYRAGPDASHPIVEGRPI